MIKEYSNKETVEGDPILYALKTKAKANAPQQPMIAIIGHAVAGLVNHSLKINCMEGSLKVLNFPSPAKI